MLSTLSSERTKYVVFFIAFFLALPILHAQVPSYIPQNGLVGYWPFNGNANDAYSVDASKGSLGSVGNWKSQALLASLSLFRSKSLILFRS